MGSKFLSYVINKVHVSCLKQWKAYNLQVSKYHMCVAVAFSSYKTKRKKRYKRKPEKAMKTIVTARDKTRHKQKCWKKNEEGKRQKIKDKIQNTKEQEVMAYIGRNRMVSRSCSWPPLRLIKKTRQHNTTQYNTIQEPRQHNTTHHKTRPEDKTRRNKTVCRVMSCLVSCVLCLVLPCLVMSCLVFCCVFVLPFRVAFSCCVVSCLFWSYLVWFLFSSLHLPLSCLVVACLGLVCLVLSCLVVYFAFSKEEGLGPIG